MSKNDEILQVMASLSSPKIDALFLPFLSIFRSEFLIPDLISRLIVNKNVISVYRNLSWDVDNQKQIKSRKLKISILFNGSLNTLSFF